MGQARYIGSTFAHTGGNVGDLLCRQSVETRRENLRKTADNIEWRPYLVVHILDEGGNRPPNR